LFDLKSVFYCNDERILETSILKEASRLKSHEEKYSKSYSQVFLPAFEDLGSLCSSEIKHYFDSHTFYVFSPIHIPSVHRYCPILQCILQNTYKHNHISTIHPSDSLSAEIKSINYSSLSPVAQDQGKERDTVSPAGGPAPRPRLMAATRTMTEVLAVSTAGVTKTPPEAMRARLAVMMLPPVGMKAPPEVMKGPPGDMKGPPGVTKGPHEDRPETSIPPRTTIIPEMIAGPGTTEEESAARLDTTEEVSTIAIDLKIKKEFILFHLLKGESSVHCTCSINVSRVNRLKISFIESL